MGQSSAAGPVRAIRGVFMGSRTMQSRTLGRSFRPTLAMASSRSGTKSGACRAQPPIEQARRLRQPRQFASRMDSCFADLRVMDRCQNGAGASHTYLRLTVLFVNPLDKRFLTSKA